MNLKTTLKKAALVGIGAWTMSAMGQEVESAPVSEETKSVQKQMKPEDLLKIDRSTSKRDTQFKDTQYRYYFTKADDIDYSQFKKLEKEGNKIITNLNLKDEKFTTSKLFEASNITLENVSFAPDSALSTSALTTERMQKPLGDEKETDGDFRPNMTFTARNSKLPEALFFDMNTKLDIDKDSDLSQVRVLRARVDQLTPDLIKKMPNLKRLELIAKASVGEVSDFGLACHQKGVSLKNIDLSMDLLQFMKNDMRRPSEFSNDKIQKNISKKITQSMMAGQSQGR